MAKKVKPQRPLEIGDEVKSIINPELTWFVTRTYRNTCWVTPNTEKGELCHGEVYRNISYDILKKIGKRRSNNGV